MPLKAGDIFVFCSDGISEAMDPDNAEFTSPRVIEVVEQTLSLTHLTLPTSDLV